MAPNSHTQNAPDCQAQLSDVEREQQALAAVRQAIDAIGRAVPYVWQWGDGEGGHVLNALRIAVESNGGVWPGATEPAPRKKAKISRSLAKQVFERDAYRCVTCGSHINLSCDHVVPESKGGPTTFANLQTMCLPCNMRKGAKA